MTRVSDQFEVEPAILYSGSYTDNIFTPGTIFDETRKVFYSHANEHSQSNPLSVGFGLDSIHKIAVIFGPGLRFGRYDYTAGASPGGATITNPSSSVYLRESIASPSQNLLVKFFNKNEQFADTVLPAPPDVFLENGGQLTEGFAEYKFPNSLFPAQFGSSSNLIGGPNVSYTPRKFCLILGSSGRAQLTSSSDSSMVSDNTWVYSYPFENRYRNLPRFLTPNFNQKYGYDLQQSFGPSQSDWTQGWFSNFVTPALYLKGPADFEVQSHRHTAVTGSIYTLSYCFSTRGDERLWQTDTGITGSYDNRRRYVKLLKSSCEVDSRGIFKPTGTLDYPDLDFIYKGFYGFFKHNNKSDPYSTSYERTGSNIFIRDNGGDGTADHSINSQLRNKGFGEKHIPGYGFGFNAGNLINRAGFPSHPAVAGYMHEGIMSSSGPDAGHYYYMAIEDFNVHSLRVNGWKYGVYHASPAFSSLYFRRSKFGQFRDILEQRPFTKYYDVSTGQSLRAALEIKFVTGSLAAITASNRSLNVLDSGMFDREGKSGRPFSDRDRE